METENGAAGSTAVGPLYIYFCFEWVQMIPHLPASCFCVAAKLLYTVPGLNGEQAISCIAEGGYTAALGHGGMEGKVKLWDLKTGVC